VLVAGIAVPYLGSLVFGAMPFILDARAMAGTGLVLGATACLVGGRRGAPLNAAFWLLAVLAAGTLAVGVDALITEDTTLLAVFMGGIVAVWALSPLRHAWPTAGAKSLGGPPLVGSPRGWRRARQQPRVAGMGGVVSCRPPGPGRAGDRSQPGSSMSYAVTSRSSAGRTTRKSC